MQRSAEQESDRLDRVTRKYCGLCCSARARARKVAKSRSSKERQQQHKCTCCTRAETMFTLARILCACVGNFVMCCAQIGAAETINWPAHSQIAARSLCACVWSRAHSNRRVTCGARRAHLCGEFVNDQSVYYLRVRQLCSHLISSRRACVVMLAHLEQRARARLKIKWICSTRKLNLA